MTGSVADCVLCREPGGTPIAQDARLRVIRADDPDFPLFYRVVWNQHIAEFSDLAETDRQHCMAVVVAVERALRAMPEPLRPHKINLAALGNAVPHLHWHVIGRHTGDTRFPGAVWAPALRPRDEARLAALGLARADVERRLLSSLRVHGLQPI
jgi:diadenosine tetraphosphate (Ap4A) HIT family hydrolase